MNTQRTVEYFDFQGKRYYKGSRFTCQAPQGGTVLVTFCAYDRKTQVFHLTRQPGNSPYLLSKENFRITQVEEQKNQGDLMDETIEKIYDSRYRHWVEDGEDFFAKKSSPWPLAAYVTALALAALTPARIYLWAAATAVFLVWKWRMGKG